MYISIVSTFLNIRASYWSTSLRGRRSKGKGKGIRTRDHARGRREEVSLPPSSRAPRLLSRLKLPFTKLPFPSLSLPFPFPFPSLSNACHAGYWSTSSGFRLLGEIPAGAVTMETKVGGIAHFGKKKRKVEIKEET